jgi:hypothetical protein
MLHLNINSIFDMNVLLAYSISIYKSEMYMLVFSNYYQNKSDADDGGDTDDDDDDGGG